MVAFTLTLLLNILSADAYSVIVVSDNGEGGSWAYQYFLSTPAGSGGDPSRSEIEHWALERCRRYGGVNPKVVLSTRKHGYFAIATGRAGTKNQAYKRAKSVVGWAGPLPSPRLASREAIRNCENRGGINPQVGRTGRISELDFLGVQRRSLSLSWSRISGGKYKNAGMVTSLKKLSYSGYSISNSGSN